MNAFPPGWYPDPADPTRSRYWDGRQWSGNASAGWGATPAPATDFGNYTPQGGELTGSGMRRLPALFSDVGRILRRAWWPITAASLAVWVAWFAIAAVVVSAVVDLGRVAQAIALLLDTTQRYPGGRWPMESQRTIEAAFTGLLRIESPTWLLAAAALLGAAGLVAASFQIATVCRLGADAAADLPVSWAAGWRAGVTGGTRLLGYFVIVIVAVGAGVAAFAALTLAAATINLGLAILIALVGALALSVAAVWGTGRFVPTLVQASLGPGAAPWSWRATRDRFWAVLGRFLLWSIVASLVAQTVLTIVFFPVSLVTFSTTATPEPDAVTAALFGYAVSLALSFVLAALTYIGVVPIWRDLTTDPRYRAIETDGVRPSGSS